MTHQGSWPTYGQPEVLPSWGFRALLWPVWQAGGLFGLFAWRWATTACAFIGALLIARRLGARGSIAWIVIVVAGLIGRYRSQLRPESLASILLVIEMLILETRRARGADRSWWIPLLACAWANVHISFYLCPLLLGLYALPDWLSRGGRGARTEPQRRDLLPVLLATGAACFVNPFGARAVIQPFEYFFVWRHEPIFRTISELQGIDWGFNARNGLLVCMLAWPALQLARWRAKRGDPVEFLLWAAFTATALLGQRFVTTWAIVAAPFLGRDLEWLVERAAPHRPRFPALLTRVAAAAACVVICVPEWLRPELQMGLGVDPLAAPEGACRFIERTGVRGRFFNHFELSGLLLWHFWPQRDRLPFMDIHQSGSSTERLLYTACMSDGRVWPAMAAKYAFDVALIRRVHARGDRMLDFLDADSTWSMVFVDDVAAVYLRRDGPFAGVARDQAYHVVSGGLAKLAALEPVLASDSTRRAAFRAELERAAATSDANSSIRSVLATLDLVENRPDSAIVELRRARAVDPLLPHFDDRLDAAERALGAGPAPGR